jgi:hypothetical protein
MAATLPNSRPAGYYAPSKIFELHGNPEETTTAPYADDPPAARAV